MRIVFYATDSHKCMNIYRALAEKHNVKLLSVNDHDFKLAEDDIPMLRGMWPYCHDWHQYWWDIDRDFIAIDNGYFFRYSLGKQYWRYTWNIHQAVDYFECPSDRWDALNIPILPWKYNENGPIILCPSPENPSLYYGLRNWVNLTVAEIRKYTDREIIIRDKPKGVLTIDAFQDAIKDAYCVITHTSMAAVEAALFGIPIIVHPQSSAAMVGCTKLSDLNNLRYPDRQSWVNWLAYNQFSYADLRDGTAIRELLKRNAKQNICRMGP